MARETFTPHRFDARATQLLGIIVALTEQYMAEGFTLTLRQLYYQLVSRDIIPNSEREYKRVGKIVANGRLAGEIDWDAIEDRGRIPKQNPHWSSTKDLVGDAAEAYAIDKWARQPAHVEVWVEKDALSGVIEPICRANDVTFMANRGYSSLSAMYEASLRLCNAISENREPCIIYLGDHDPSGMDMTRDIEERLSLFCYHEIEVRRIALNMDQVKKYNPPPNPAKLTDSRSRRYVAVYGRSSWELDALEPKVLAALVENEIADLREDDLWEEACAEETRGRNRLKLIASKMRK